MVRFSDGSPTPTSRVEPRTQESDIDWALSGEAECAGLLCMQLEFDRSASRIALTGRLGQAYDEETFLYFLEIERKRLERSGCPLLLLLADLSDERGTSTELKPAVASRLFSGFWSCLRETDFTGWYRHGRVAGAVLTQLANEASMEVSRMICQRVAGTLAQRLPSDTASQLRVRAHQLPPRLKS